MLTLLPPNLAIHEKALVRRVDYPCVNIHPAPLEQKEQDSNRLVGPDTIPALKSYSSRYSRYDIRVSKIQSLPT